MRKGVLFITIMAILISRIAYAENRAVVKANGEADGAEFYNDLRTDQKGYLYNGVCVQALDSLDEWTRIRLSDGLLSIEGFVRTEGLDTNQESTWAPHPIKIGVAKSTADIEVSVFEGPRHDFEKINVIPANARVVVLGTLSDYYLIQYQGRYAFVSSEELILDDGSVMPDCYGGVPEIGYLFLNPNAAIPAVLKASTNPSSPTIDHPWLPSDGTFVTERSIECIADLGEWYQVRIMDESGCGYMQKGDFQDAIFFKDILIESIEPLSEGTYHVGTDLEPGLYTYTTKGKGLATLTITGGGNDLNKNIEATANSSYTLYLSDGMTIVLTGEGKLEPMKQEPVISDETDMRISGNGMFFVKSQFPPFLYGTTGVSYVFSVLDQTKKGTITIYNLKGNMINQTVLEKEDLYQTTPIEIDDSTFVEIENCVLQIQFSHNG